DNKYNYYRLDVTKNAGGKGTQLAEIALSNQYDSIQGEITDDVESVHADEENPPDEIASKLIDQNNETKWLSGKNTARFTMKLSEPKAVSKYALTSANDFPERDPQDWTLYGSKDGENWTKVDEQSGIHFERRFQLKAFKFENSEKYT